MATKEQTSEQSEVQMTGPARITFDDETFERLLHDGDNVYDWFAAGQRSLHMVDDAELRIRCR